jgi:large subunit ribosomal protein L21
MYAIVEIAGQQFKVSKDQRIFVHQLAGNEGDKVEFSKVLLIDQDGKISVGAPAVDGASVSAKIERHVKGDKVIVFKKKRRKGYQKSNGHRQRFTEITISGITIGKAKASKKEAEAAE